MYLLSLSRTQLLLYFVGLSYDKGEESVNLRARLLEEFEAFRDLIFNLSSFTISKYRAKY